MTVKNEKDKKEQKANNKELEAKAKALCSEMGAAEIKTRKLLASNMDFIMHKYVLKQWEFADLLGCAASRITTIMQEKWNPSIFPILYKMKEIFGYTSDELLYTDIKKTDNLIRGRDNNLPMASYMSITNLYQGYYFATSAFKGREYTNDTEALKSCIILVYKDGKTNGELKAIGLFNLKKDRADNYYNTLWKNGNQGNTNIRNHMVSMIGENVYYGNVEISEKNIYIGLNYENSRDQVRMIFHLPQSNSNKYIGGLGNMISISKGRSSAPCVQHIALSSKSLDVSSEEIAEHLLMHYPNLKTYEASEELVDMLVKLYNHEEERVERLTEEQKKILVRNHVDKIVNETVEKNLFRMVIVSEEDDDGFYHYLKRVQ